MADTKNRLTTTAGDAVLMQMRGRLQQVEGGYRLSGRFPFGSGIAHADAVAIRWSDEACPTRLLQFRPSDFPRPSDRRDLEYRR